MLLLFLGLVVVIALPAHLVMNTTVMRRDNWEYKYLEVFLIFVLFLMKNTY